MKNFQYLRSNRIQEVFSLPDMYLQHAKALVGGMDLELPRERKVLNSEYFLDLKRFLN